MEDWFDLGNKLTHGWSQICSWRKLIAEATNQQNQESWDDAHLCLLKVRMLHGKMHRCNFYLRLEKISSAVANHIHNWCESANCFKQNESLAFRSQWRPPCCQIGALHLQNISRVGFQGSRNGTGSWLLNILMFWFKEYGGVKYVSIMGRAFPCTAAERCEGRRWRGMVLVFSHIKMLSGAMCCPPCQPSAVEGGGAVQSKNRNSKRGSLAFMAPLI